MTVQDIIISAMTREGVYKNVPNIFSTTELLVQENVRVLNELLEDIIHKNSLSELLQECAFTTYQQFHSGETYAAGQVIYSGKYRYAQNTTSVAVDDPASLGLKPGESGTTPDGNTWNCLGDWNQYPFDTLAPDCAGIDTGTMVNLNQRVPMQAVNMHQWMVLKASSVAVGTTGIFNIRNRSIYIFPGLADGTPIQFLYYTMQPVVAADGTRKEKFDNSSDTCLIPDQILLLGTTYRWLKDKDIGNWAEIEKEFYETLAQHEAQGQAPQQIDMAGGALKNVSNYSDGNWNI